MTRADAPDRPRIGRSAMAFVLVLASVPAGAVGIEFDYRFDSSGFFDDPERRAVLSLAAAPYADFLDSLSTIAPTGDQHWSVRFRDPSWQSYFDTVTVTDLVVPEDTLVIFVGASASHGSVLGIAESGVIQVDGDTAFTETVLARGQAGALAEAPTDVGPWGGAIWFNSAADWYVGTTPDPTGSAMADFYTTAVHEIGHLFGFGEAASWQAQIETIDGVAVFTGEAAVAAHGAPVPVDAVGAHWASGVGSQIDGQFQSTLMDPSTVRGQREWMTELDRAGFADIGWQVSPVPEPATAWMWLAGAGLLAQCRRGPRARAEVGA